MLFLKFSNNLLQGLPVGIGVRPWNAFNLGMVFLVGLEYPLDVGPDFFLGKKILVFYDDFLKVGFQNG